MLIAKWLTTRLSFHCEKALRLELNRNTVGKLVSKAFAELIQHFYFTKRT